MEREKRQKRLVAKRKDERKRALENRIQKLFPITPTC